MGLRIVRQRPATEEFDLRMVEWETLLAREAERWAEWRLTNSEDLKQSFRQRIQRNQITSPNAEDHLRQLLQVETKIKQLQNIKSVHGQKALDSETIVELL
jgi:hypothetical protein